MGSSWWFPFPALKTGCPNARIFSTLVFSFLKKGMHLFRECHLLGWSLKQMEKYITSVRLSHPFLQHSSASKMQLNSLQHLISTFVWLDRQQCLHISAVKRALSLAPQRSTENMLYTSLLHKKTKTGMARHPPTLFCYQISFNFWTYLDFEL